ncbi:MAG: UDP-N-acetylmuramoyl-L-alanine--D-glutamate ligase [Bacteroidales bacterium]
MNELLKKYLSGKRILILGFGREGRSTYRYLKTHFPKIEPAIADQNPALDLSEVSNDHPELFLGREYLQALDAFDVVFKSPGIDFNGKLRQMNKIKILTQSGLFLERYRDQIIGITGTKGKSTTSSLIHHILGEAGKNPVLVGNIGLPPFDHISRISAHSPVVFELSAHQLEHAHHSPHIAILLNIFQEHLDYFGSLAAYTEAKLRIARFQQPSDFLISGPEIPALEQPLNTALRGTIIPVETEAGMVIFETKDLGKTIIRIDTGSLAGMHNRQNIAAAAIASALAGIPGEMIEAGIQSFTPLEHRMEFVGTFGGIRFYNDSISTIPESTIRAVESIAGVETLILGGHDRGIAYDGLAAFLAKSKVMNLIVTGPAGNRIRELLEPLRQPEQKIFSIRSFEELPAILKQHARVGSACLLSPAASSYDRFRNFEERGAAFKKIAGTL